LPGAAFVRWKDVPVKHTRLPAAIATDARLREAYRRCRAINAAHGRTFFLATRLLTRSQRPAIHALYGFARVADDIVDGPTTVETGADGSSESLLEVLADNLRTGLRTGASDDLLIAAVVDTATRYAIAENLFEEFLASMRMDLTVTAYPDRASLDRYVRGSAEAIGLQVLPILGTVGDPADAAPHAAALGKAFHLTNFLRDVGEDLDRGRVYLPADELAAFGVHRELLMWCRQRRRTDARVKAALAAQHAVTRRVYRSAEPGIALLHPVSRPCVATAFTLYAQILSRIEDADFAVFASRATVRAARRIRVAGPALARALWARRGGHAFAQTVGTSTPS
jgi:15-cis-phytoene synthase